MSDEETPQALGTRLANAAEAVAQAHGYLNRMRDLHARALRDETDASNRVREAQQKFDALVAEVKKSAPRDTDWKRSPGFPVSDQ